MDTSAGNLGAALLATLATTVATGAPAAELAPMVPSAGFLGVVAILEPHTALIAPTHAAVATTDMEDNGTLPVYIVCEDGVLGDEFYCLVEVFAGDGTMVAHANSSDAVERLMPLAALIPRAAYEDATVTILRARVAARYHLEPSVPTFITVVCAEC